MKIINEGYRVAYTDHICDYSGDPILKNHRYYYFSAEINGQILNAKVSLSCLNQIDEERSFLIGKSEMYICAT